MSALQESPSIVHLLTLQEGPAVTQDKPKGSFAPDLYHSPSQEQLRQLGLLIKRGLWGVAILASLGATARQVYQNTYDSSARPLFPPTAKAQENPVPPSIALGSSNPDTRLVLLDSPELNWESDQTHDIIVQVKSGETVTGKIQIRYSLDWQADPNLRNVILLQLRKDNPTINIDRVKPEERVKISAKARSLIKELMKKKSK